jgi:hypothetical protein
MPVEREWLNGSAWYPDAALEALPATLSAVFSSGAIPKRFFYYFTADGGIEEVQGVPGRRLARFGHTRPGDYVAVDLDTSEVFHIRVRGTGDVTLINSSLEAFSEFMWLCETRYPYYTTGGDADFDVFVAAANRLKSELSLIDSHAFEPGSYWSDFLSDVGNGDYGEPSDEDEDEDEDE